MNQTKANTSTVSLLYVGLYIIVLTLCFLTRIPGSFYNAGPVEDNLWHFHEHAQCIGGGRMPYSASHLACVARLRKTTPDRVVFEYPPGAAVVLGIMGVAGSSRAAFETVYTGLMLGMFALALMLALNEADALRGAGGPDRRLAVFVGATIAALSCGPVAVVSFDLIPAVLCVAAALVSARGRVAVGAALWAAAVAIKGYPVVLAPVMWVLWRRHDRAALGAGVAAAVLAVFILPALLVSHSNFLKSFTYHGGRGLEFNSLYASLAIQLQQHSPALTREFSHGSWNLHGAGLVALFEKSSNIMLLLGLVSAATGCFVSAKRSVIENNNPDNAIHWAVRWSMILISIFMIFFKVGSPQFFCWLMPFVPLLVLRPGGFAPVLCFALAGHAAIVVFPHLWQIYVTRIDTQAAAIVLFRHIVLAAMVVFLVFGHDAGAGKAPETETE
jgi:hypothetical protein